MSKVKPTTKEQLVYYLMQNISLGTYDKKFLTNLQSSHYKDKNPVTSNQAELLNKIILRYARQLRKKELDADLMIKLPWGVEPIESLPEYTDAFCTIKDNIIEVRSPYKKDFVKDIKNTSVYLTWEKETKIWSGPFCEVVLKHFIDCLDKHYQVVRYCTNTTEIINRFAEYEGLTWDPIYKKVNGNYVIAATNRYLDEATANIPLNISPSSLARIRSAGIDIDEQVIYDSIESINNDPEALEIVDFAVSDRVVFHIGDLEKLVRFIKRVGCDFVVVQEVFKNVNATHQTELKKLLTESNIDHCYIAKNAHEDIDLSKYEFPILVNTALWSSGNFHPKSKIAKTVHLGNNKPINVK